MTFNPSDTVVVLVTGGNQGLGLATIEAILATGKSYDVILGSRSLENGKQAVKGLEPGRNQRVTALQCDIEDDSSVEACYAEVEKGWGRIDVLLNNAGASFDLLSHERIDFARGMLGDPNHKGFTPREVWTKSWALNVMATHFFTERFVPLLLQSKHPRIIFISTAMSSIGDQATTDWPANKSPAAGWPKEPGFSIPAYRSSKAGANMMASEWRRILKEDGVVVHIVDPGQLATNFGSGNAEAKRQRGIKDPSEGGQWVTQVVEGAMDEHAGKLISYGKVMQW